MQARSDDGWLRALSGPRKWRQAQGERVVAAWRASGKSMIGFAHEHGLNVGIRPPDRTPAFILRSV